MRVIGTTVGIAGLCLLVSACSSVDRHTFVSTPLLPATLTVIGTADEQVHWQMDIPAGYQLTVDFDEPHQSEILRARTASSTRMRWWLRRSDRTGTAEHGIAPMPLGLPLLMKVTYRAAPEMPAAPPRFGPKPPQPPAAPPPAETDPCGELRPAQWSGGTIEGDSHASAEVNVQPDLQLP